MIVTLNHPKLKNTYRAVPSKSAAERALICGAFCTGEVRIICPGYGDDVRVTAQCLKALGLKAEPLRGGNCIGFMTGAFNPDRLPGSGETAVLDCRESAANYRFFSEIAEVLQGDIRLIGTPRLLERISSGAPTSQRESGRLLARAIGDSLACLSRGGQKPEYTLNGGGQVLPEVSPDYVRLTKKVLSDFGWDRPGDVLRSPGTFEAEGDWSLGAVWLAAGFMAKQPVNVEGLDENSTQGDRRIREILRAMSGPGEITLNGSVTPDLVPLLAVTGAFRRDNTVIRRVGYLRFKESDRLKNAAELVRDLGGRAEAREDSLIIYGTGGLKGGSVSGRNDHRIVMAAAAAAFGTEQPVTVSGAEAVNKSMPGFWDSFEC